jgi:hypothetical protein
MRLFQEIDVGNFYNKRSRLIATLSGLILIVVIGIFDYLTSPVFSSLIAYLASIIFVTHFSGRTSGILISTNNKQINLSLDFPAEKTLLIFADTVQLNRITQESPG